MPSTQSPGFKPRHFLNQACWCRPVIPETGGSEIQDRVERWLGRYRPFASQPDDLRSPHRERRGQSLHVILTLHAAVVYAKSPHEVNRCVLSREKETRLVNGATKCKRAKSSTSCHRYNTHTHTHSSSQTIKKKDTSNPEARLKPNRHEANASKFPKFTEQQPCGVGHSEHSFSPLCCHRRQLCLQRGFLLLLPAEARDGSSGGYYCGEAVWGVRIPCSSPHPQVTTFHSSRSGELRS